MQFYCALYIEGCGTIMNFTLTKSSENKAIATCLRFSKIYKLKGEWKVVKLNQYER